jgi:hypothetical protein
MESRTTEEGEGEFGDETVSMMMLAGGGGLGVGDDFLTTIVTPESVSSFRSARSSFSAFHPFKVRLAVTVPAVQCLFPQQLS